MTSPSRVISRAWAEIHADALAHNIVQLRARYGQNDRTRLMAVVKANAYGHDVGLIAPLCAQQGIADFGIATVEEGIALRALLPDATLFLLCAACPDETPPIVAARLIPLVGDLEFGRALADAARAQNTVAEAHLDVDTGIGRSGVWVNDAPALLHTLDTLPSLRVTGLMTHFASADEDPADARAQYALFLGLSKTLGARANTLLVHAANSPATLLNTLGASHQMIRPGLLLYGIAPAPGMVLEAGLDVRPVLTLKARVLVCRPLPGGATISYGRTYAVPPGGGIYATLGIGYGDGFPRGLSNRGFALLHGQRAPIRGRVCMDQLVVDVTQIPGVRAGDTATLIGDDRDLSAGALAAVLGTTPHEITTCLNARIPRLLMSGGV